MAEQLATTTNVADVGDICTFGIDGRQMIGIVFTIDGSLATVGCGREKHTIPLADLTPRITRSETKRADKGDL